MDVMGRSRDLTPFLISPKNLSNYISKIKNLIEIDHYIKIKYF